MISPHGDSCLCCNRGDGDGGNDVGAGSGGAGSDAAGASNAHTLLSIQ